MEPLIEAPNTTGVDTQLAALLAQLASADSAVRGRARRALVQLGSPAVAPLIAMLASRSGNVRWEATNVLSHIGSPAATDALITALDDERRGIRWLAANGLIAIGQSALVPLLRAILANPADPCLLSGAHHVLAALGTHADGDMVAPLLKALEGPVPTLEVQVAAYQAIAQLERAGMPN